MISLWRKGGVDVDRTGGNGTGSLNGRDDVGVWCNLQGGADIWLPWHAWEWWDSWGLWWSEGGGESVNLGVLGEDGNVVVPGGLGTVIAGLGGTVSGGDGLTHGVVVDGNLEWEVSDLSLIPFSCCTC